MGYRCRWIATRTADHTAALARCKLAVTGELNEEVYDPGLYAVDVDGWFVVFGDGWDFMDLVQPEQARELSIGGEALFLYTDDSPMCAELTSYVAGKPAWSIVYRGQDGITIPEVTGAPPEVAQTVLAAARKAQQEAEDVDHLYEVVAEVGHRLVGFRHDQTLGDGKHLPVLVLTA